MGPPLPDVTTLLCALVGDDASDAVTKILENGVEVNKHDLEGSTPLGWQLQMAMTKWSNYCFRSTQSRALRAPAKETPLHAAVKHKRVVELLLKAQADVNARTCRGQTSLMLAMGEDYEEDVVNLLLDSGADPNARDKDGSTALHKAAACNRLGILKSLVDKGADINAKILESGFRNDSTPLLLAIRNNRVAFAQELLDKGAILDTRCEAAQRVK